VQHRKRKVSRVPRPTRPLLGWFAVLTGLAALLAVGGSAGAADGELSTGERQEAEAIYANQCATCHGSDGGGGTIPGTTDEAPPLAGNPGVTVAYLDLTLRVGRMPPPRNNPYDNRARNVLYSEDQRRALVTYLAGQFDLEGEIPEPPAGEASRGRAIYAANCAQCHGSTGAGGVAGAGAWTPPVVNRDATAIAEAIRVGPFEMPRFGEDQISDQEIGDVAAFLHFVGEEQGTPLGLVELNPVYASGFAFLFAVVILFSALWIAGRPTHFPDPTEHDAAAQPTAAKDDE
jgi:ubiquinol-cytochrome c reductase cytochrome c subunit